MNVKFWGVRGSIPTPSPETVHFGGNTSCVSVDFGSDMVIFDAGTGLRPLGNSILKSSPIPHLYLFLSHVHWDHIQGFPFFGPSYQPGIQMEVFGQGAADHTLGKILAGQMEGPNFPVSLSHLEANISYKDIHSGTLVELKNPTPFAEVTCADGNHPNGVLIYRIEDLITKSKLVYATDTEHYPDRMDFPILELAKGADILIYDGMYTPEEYASKHRGWGHSTWEKGFELAVAAGVKTLVIFHHDPSHSDEFLIEYEKNIQAQCQKQAPKLKVLLAREGMEFEI